MAQSLLDASAVLALIHGEPGADEVIAALRHGAAMSAVNLEEVTAHLAIRGWNAEEVATTIGNLHIEVVPFDSETALRSGTLRPATAFLGLGLGDRACLATAAIRGVPALTADRAWLKLRLPELEVRSVR